jgi:hypothetical protein
VASLQARSPLRSTHLLLLLNKFLSLTAFTLVLCAGWVALSYLRTEWSHRPKVNANEKSAAAPAEANMQTRALIPVEARRLSAPVRLVYSCAGDREFYHVSTHLPPRASRSAISEEAALRRGLKPCSICVRE